MSESRRFWEKAQNIAADIVARYVKGTATSIEAEAVEAMLRRYPEVIKPDRVAGPHYISCDQKVRLFTVETHEYLNQWPGFCRACLGSGKFKGGEEELLVDVDFCQKCIEQGKCPRCTGPFKPSNPPNACDLCQWFWEKSALPSPPTCFCYFEDPEPDPFNPYPFIGTMEAYLTGNIVRGYYDGGVLIGLVSVASVDEVREVMAGANSVPPECVTVTHRSGRKYVVTFRAPDPGKDVAKHGA